PSAAPALRAPETGSGRGRPEGSIRISVMSLCVLFSDDADLSAHKTLNPPTDLPYPLDDPASYGQLSAAGLATYEPLEVKGYLDQTRPVGPPALSPRIEITPSREHFSHGADPLQGPLYSTSPRPTLTVPRPDGLSYRDQPCLSPASSNSSTSWHSENYSPWASPCVSPSSGQSAADLCPRFQGFHAGAGSPRTSPGTSPCASGTDEGVGGGRSPSPRPGSRSVSPQGKRTYQMYRHPGRSPSPQATRDHQQSGVVSSGQYVSELNGFGSSQPNSLPAKIVKTTNGGQAYSVYPELPADSYVFQCQQDVKAKPESFYVIPPPIWTGICSIPVASLPPLEWPLPSRTDQYELHIEVQPKPHHRAHYETEGSRGAVKAPTGGHPVVQLRGYRGKEPLGLQIFIGTADERILKPHAFYQVHRITGKTVTTASYEKVIHGTKVLEIPLEPKTNMKAIIDCAGILKLRNADIELRKGETDIGRKNTRVRLVFRVHVPQPGGQATSLQAVSNPIECSQRSAHELPMVEKQDLDGCCVLGGQQMILTGQNFSSDSKVIFTEKSHEGQQIWEVEATVDKDKSQASMMFIEVPAFRDPAIRHPVKVNFYVINGKRKRSQPQHFTYTPLPVASIKTEPADEYERAQLGYNLPQFYHTPSLAPAGDQQHSPAIVFSRGAKAPSAGPALFPQPGGGAGAAPDPHRSVLVHAGSPAQTPPLGGHAHSHPSIIQFSPTNAHLLRGAAPDPQHVLYNDGFVPPAATPRPPVQPYPTVIQQQPYAQKMPKTRSPPAHLDGRSPALPGRVTVKQENLDQAYLDDGE
uniref:RHD domain-containing protein n=2 Tax=Denticeps clupeoides TaxID=299321 RepID=A0A8C4BGX5_9TELE